MGGQQASGQRADGRGRAQRARRVAVVAGATVLLALVAAGCGSGSGGSGPSASASPQWTQVLTSKISGAKPVKVNLGTVTLGSAVRLQWKLSGPVGTPPVTLAFRMINQKNGVGYGSAWRAKDANFSLDNPAAFVQAPIWTGKYTAFFSQRFPPAKGPGYDAELTIWTTKQ
jgi:hypothetical protein